MPHTCNQTGASLLSRCWALQTSRLWVSARATRPCFHVDRADPGPPAGFWQLQAKTLLH